MLINNQVPYVLNELVCNISLFLYNSFIIFNINTVAYLVTAVAYWAGFGLGILSDTLHLSELVVI